MPRGHGKFVGCLWPQTPFMPTGHRAPSEADSRSGEKVPEGNLELSGTARCGELAEAQTPPVTRCHDESFTDGYHMSHGLRHARAHTRTCAHQGEAR